jgi:LacI family transcriptional regulator, gluconate utilization system Gnt-I transcriptional repressor
LNDSISRDVDRTVRVEDVAREAGVSPITVSRALRTPDLVKPATRAKVAAAVAKTGYVVNPIASSLRSGQSAFVSVFVASLQNLHYAAAMQGMIDAFEGTRFRLTFSQAGYAEDIGAEQVRAMLPFKPAAVVFSGIVRDEGARSFLKSLGVPVMEMWGDVADPIDMLVMSQAREGGRLIGEHFGQQGFRRIAYIGHTSSRAQPRIQGFDAALKLYGSGISLLYPAEGTVEMQDGVEVVEKVLAKLPDCDAMMFGTDVMAAGALVKLQQLGISVPGQIALAGYGDLFFAAHTVPSMTSVHTSPYEVGRRTGDLLLERLSTGKVVQRILQVPLRLEIRDSTRRNLR